MLGIWGKPFVAFPGPDLTRPGKQAVHLCNYNLHVPNKFCLEMCQLKFNFSILLLDIRVKILLFHNMFRPGLGLF